MGKVLTGFQNPCKSLIPFKMFWERLDRRKKGPLLLSLKGWLMEGFGEGSRKDFNLAGTENGLLQDCHYLESVKEPGLSGCRSTAFLPKPHLK